MLFDESILNHLMNESKHSSDETEYISRENFPLFTVASDKPVFAQNDQIKESYKTQSDVQKNIALNIDRLLLDCVGSSLYLLQKLYKDNNHVNLAANVTAAAVAATTPLFHIKSKSNNQTEVNRMTELLMFPNLNETGYELFYKTALSLSVYANAYWHVIKKRGGGIHSIYFIPPTTMRAVPFINKKNNLMEFVYFQMDGFTNKVKRVFFQEEIIHFKMPNPESIVYGFSQLVPLLYDLSFDQEAKKWVTSWLQKTFNGGMIFKMENATKEQVKRNRQEVKEKFEGSENAGRTLITEGGLTLVYDGNKARDLDLSTLKNISRDAIINCMKVPLSSAGIRSNSGTINSELIDSENIAMLRNAVMPIHRAIYDKLNSSLFKFILKSNDLSIKEGANSSFNLSNIESIVKTASQFGGNSINENRALMNLPEKDINEFKDKIDNQDYYNVPIIATNNGMLPLKDLFKSFQDGSQLGVDTKVKQPTLKVEPDKSKAVVE